jgi:hypothetical protein
MPLKSFLINQNALALRGADVSLQASTNAGQESIVAELIALPALMIGLLMIARRSRAAQRIS